MSKAITNAAVKKEDAAYVFHSWSIQGELDPLAIATASGSYLYDFAGKAYLDFSSQLVYANIGHGHPQVIKAITTQAQKLAVIAPAIANDTRNQAAKSILRHLPPEFAKVFFTNAGADANENAIRMARIFTGKRKILSAYRSYHGNTGAAINATGDARRIPNEYAAGHVHFFTPYLYRSDFFAANDGQETERALQHLERIIAVEKAESIAAVILESIPGTAGILLPSKEYMQGVRKITAKHNILLIIDEVMTGFGRTGKWFACERYGIIPDLITFAKGVNSGYVPAGGIAVGRNISDFFQDHFFPGGLTYSGHPLAMAAIVATIKAMEDEKIVENAAAVGKIFKKTLASWPQSLAVVGAVRGIGAFWAVELVKDKKTKEPLSSKKMAIIKSELIRRGLFPFIADNRLHLAPPCNISKEDVRKGLDIIYTTLSSCN